VIRSLKEGCENPTVGRDGGASICGTTGTWIAGGGGGGSGGGLNTDPPGGMISWAEAAPATSAHITTPIRIDDNRFMEGYVVIPRENRKQPQVKLFVRCVLDRVEPVGLKVRQTTAFHGF
jgi:hypothetical protein